jgi:hypothetical protein
MSIIFRRHFQTFYNYGLYEWVGKRKVPFSDIFTFLILPLILSLLLVWLDPKIVKTFSELIITSLSIFIGLLFSLLTLIFDLAKKEKEKLIIKDSNSVERAPFVLMKEMFVNISYSIILSIFCIISVFIAKFRPLMLINLLKNTPYFGVLRICFLYLINAIVIFLIIQFVFTLLMVLRRFFIIFNKQIEAEH